MLTHWLENIFLWVSVADAQHRMYHDEEAKQEYRGLFETQKSGNKTSSGEIGLDIRTHANPKVGQDQVSGGVSVLCWHAAQFEHKK